MRVSNKIYQIYYDWPTKMALDSSLIPLDNTENSRPDWYEFWVIHNYLAKNELNDNAFYGFLSPNFSGKAGVGGRNLIHFLDNVPDHIDVVLFSSAQDQIAYFLNCFEQGESWHRGLLDVGTAFCNLLNIDIDLKSCVGHSQNTVFSNYFAAKRNFWDRWKNYANALFEICERDAGLIPNVLSSDQNYPNAPQLKVFLQERLASLVLTTETFNVVSIDLMQGFPLFDRVFNDDLRTRKLLNVCDTLKLEYSSSGDRFCLDAFAKIRRKINMKLPVTFFM